MRWISGGALLDAFDMAGCIGGEVDVAVGMDAEVADRGGWVEGGVGWWCGYGGFVVAGGFVFDDYFDGAGDGAVEVVAPGGFGDGWGFVGGGDGPEADEAFFGVAAQFEDKGEVAAEVCEVLAEAVEVGGVLVCTVGGAVVAVGKGGEEEVLHVEVEGVLVGVAVGGEGGIGGDGGGGCALVSVVGSGGWEWRALRPRWWRAWGGRGAR